MHGPGAEVLSVSLWIAIAIILICIGLSAFFAASETALTAASRARMHALEKKATAARPSSTGCSPRREPADRRDAARQHARQHRLLGLHDQHSAWPSSATAARSTPPALMTVLVLVFAEVMPKTVAINYPDRMSLLVARSLSFFVARVWAGARRGRWRSFAASCELFGVDASQQRSILSRHEELKSAVDFLHERRRRRALRPRHVRRPARPARARQSPTSWSIAPRC